MRYVWRAIFFLLLFAGVVIIGAGVWFAFEIQRIEQASKKVPEEKWVCVDQFGYGHEAIYQPTHPGTEVQVLSEEHVKLFGLSCVEKKGTHCFDNDGWGSAKIDVWGGPEPFAVFFDHESSGIDDRYRHHVFLIDDLATSLIAAFRTGKTAEVTTYGRKDEVMKVTKISLDGFSPAMDQCIAAWADARRGRK